MGLTSTLACRKEPESAGQGSGRCLSPSVPWGRLSSGFILLVPRHTSWPRSQAGRAPPSLWLTLWPLLAPPTPPDSAGSLPGRPVTGGSHWALAQPHATPWDPSPVCTEELMGFVPGEAAAADCPALRRPQLAYLAPSAHSLLPLEAPGGRSSCFLSAWGGQRSRVAGSCWVPGRLSLSQGEFYPRGW